MEKIIKISVKFKEMVEAGNTSPLSLKNIIKHNSIILSELLEKRLDKCQQELLANKKFVYQIDDFAIWYYKGGKTAHHYTFKTSELMENLAEWLRTNASFMLDKAGAQQIFKAVCFANDKEKGNIKFFDELVDALSEIERCADESWGCSIVF